MAPETSVVTITDSARSTILGLRAVEPDGDDLALRLDVTGQDGLEYLYELTFEPLAEAGPDDALGRSGELPVLVPAAAVDKLRGATLDEVDPTGLVLRNPNRPSPAAPSAPLHLEGSVEERLQQLLDGEINPMLAQHGGFATLDRVEGDTAYLGMGGGCQGCGLAKMTLTEGIKTAVEDAIPEIARVVDVTDHAAGENPFFAPT
ncbi:MAG: NifU family protein [Actinomycetota bacterium]|nr:NifU family protein [Actinomycetota bacterium]